MKHTKDFKALTADFKGVYEWFNGLSTLKPDDIKPNTTLHVIVDMINGFVKEGALWYLRIFIDKDSGVTIEDCENLTRAVDQPLDELDPIEQAYCLEVCSPGINRELSRPEHFESFLDYAVEVRLIRPDANGQKELAGILRGYDNGDLSLEDESGNAFTVLKKDISSVHLIEELLEDDVDE